MRAMIEYRTRMPAQGSASTPVLAHCAPMSPPIPKETGDPPSPLAQSTPTTGEGVNQEEKKAPREIGGRQGPEPTRFGDWEKSGRCIDF